MALLGQGINGIEHIPLRATRNEIAVVGNKNFHG